MPTPTPSRRSLLGASLAAVGASVIGAPPAGAATAGLSPALSSEGSYLITLGTAAGPAVRSERRGIATALVVDGHLYLIDAGLGVVRQIVEGGLPVGELRAVLLTHLHSDHISELPALLLYNWGAPVKGFTRPFEVVGPAGARRLPRGARPVVTPPTPGTRALITNLLDAYAYDINIRVHDENRPPLDELVRPREIELPVHARQASDPRGALAPEMEPFVVYEDERVRVLAALVDHPPIFPAYGYRVETPHGVVAISGDTAEHANVVALSRDADILVHESVFLDFYRGGNYSEEFINHLASSHTDPAGTGRVATAARARHLVLSHLAGVATDAEWSSGAGSTFDGPVTVARDGQVFAVG